MRKYFNIAGPCNATDHYMVPVLERNKNILPLIEQKQYFVIHAARQSGKTTLLHELVDYMEREGKYYALYCSLEQAQVFTEAKEGIPEVLNILRSAIKFSNLPGKENFAKDNSREDITTMVGDALRVFCAGLDKPLVLFFDEIDSLQNGTLISFLRQLRNGYITRSRIPFPHSIALVGMRNIRDYKSKIREGRQTLGSPSPFNIITQTLTLSNFSPQEIEGLYSQHTQATGQVFEKKVVDSVYDYTDGQPWLVNAIAREIIVEILDNDFTKNVTASMVGQAAKNIMLRRDTHIDSLLERLKEERVRKVMEPIITGEKDAISFTDDDTQYCLDLGLIKSEDYVLQPANKIYAEVIIRTLSYDSQYNMQSQIKNRWINPDGSLDMNGLLKAFQQFWRENSEIWAEKYQYKEAAPHLILQAFLQRVVNSGGDVLREYAANKGRMDLCVRYGENKYPLEIKLHYGAKTIPEGLAQLADYMDQVGEKTGWLVVFDRRKAAAWEEKIYWKTEKRDGKTIHVVGA
ncbi:MAG: ATP-binding protein [Lewinellaceae bacterium]|nr:ATP-binding protein [Lewinellaceae bacterium]